MTSAELLKLVRRRVGLTQADLARRAGTSQPVVSAYEHGRRDPTVGTLGKLLAGAGVQLRLDARPMADLPRSADLDEHGRRLLDVLSVADAIPTRPRPAQLDAPRLVSSWRR